MRVVRGVANGILMVTLVKPIVRLMVGRWRKRVQESAAATIGFPVQELLEAALVEELAVSTSSLETAPTGEAEPLDDGRSMRSVLLAALVIAAASAAAVLLVRAIRERRERAAQTEPSELVAVPVEVNEDVVQEVLA